MSKSSKSAGTDSAIPDTRTAVDIPLPGANSSRGSATARNEEDQLIARAWEAVQGEPPRSSHSSSTMDAPADAWDSTPSDVIPGYEILGEIHRGGQGVVYQAIQKATKRKVAIKVMKEGPFAGARDKARFEREVQILGQLNHPNIVTIHDSGTAGGSFYYVMDYISGQSLDGYIAEQSERSKNQKVKKTKSSTGKSGEKSISRADRRESLDHILRLFAEICDAVNAAHLRGVIHRDLKPGNIRIDMEGHPHILDFGLAKVATGEMIGGDEPMLMTMTGQFVGSLPWASPEQAEGIPSKIDIRTDVYSLGVILYQMLTGRFPYEVIGNMRDVLDNILTAEPEKPSTISRQINDEVETIVLKCLAKDRERRYQSAGAIAEDMNRYLSGLAINAKRDSMLYVIRKKAGQHLILSSTAILGTVIVLSWLSTFIRGYYNERNERFIASQKIEALSSQLAFLENLGKTADQQVRRTALIWFLREWDAGRDQRARQILEEMPLRVPERSAMEFLLKPDAKDSELVANMPPNSTSLGYFVVGERHAHNRRWPEAMRSYKACIADDLDSWLARAAAARLEQIQRQILIEGEQPPK